MRNMPGARLQDEMAKHQYQINKNMEGVREAAGERIEREELTARSTAAVAQFAAEQHEENRRLRYLTNLLAFAVIFDVVNGSFDNHRWWTTLISLAAGAAGLGGALLLGKWRTKKAAAAAETN